MMKKFKKLLCGAVAMLFIAASFNLSIFSATLKIPTAVTLPASSITTSSAVIGGKITADGGSNITAWGLSYSSDDYKTTTFKYYSGVLQKNTDVSFKLTGLKAGITYKFQFFASNNTGTAYGSINSFTVTSAQRPATRIVVSNVSGDKLALVIGESYTLDCTTVPVDSTDSLKYSSSSTSVCSVSSSGKIKALKTGACNITVAAGSVKTSIYVSVSSAKRPATKIVISNVSGDKLMLKISESYTLNGMTVPVDSTDSLKYSSSSTSVCSVSSSGKIKALKSGTCTITVTAGSISTSIHMVVSPLYNSNFSDYVNKTLDSSLYILKTQQNLNKAVVFFFEGEGNYTSASDYNTKRMGALCVVAKNNSSGVPYIAYTNSSCSTLPDWVRDTSKNGGKDIPTVCDGIYNITNVNHKGSYMSLNIACSSKGAVIRCNSNTSYSDLAYGINIHARSTATNSPANSTWANSAGCFLIGESNSDYNAFMLAVTGYSNAKSNTFTTTGKDMGIVIVDRTQAFSQLCSIYGSDDTGSASNVVNKILNK